ncbi:hypothetical protein Goklo_008254, partial [Gossypium klotzschianum]|nr:hypothetical protein [Gossypium klotzschianum]
WKKGFLIRWRITLLSELGLRRYNVRKVTVWTKDMYQNYGTFNRISVTQNSLQELKEIWDQWNDKVDKHLFRALAQFWNTSYSCFTFGKVDLVPMVEEYIALLRCSKIQVDRAYSRAVSVPTFLKKLMNITGMSEEYEEEGRCLCFNYLWFSYLPQCFATC